MPTMKLIVLMWLLFTNAFGKTIYHILVCVWGAHFTFFFFFFNPILGLVCSLRLDWEVLKNGDLSHLV